MKGMARSRALPTVRIARRIRDSWDLVEACFALPKRAAHPNGR